MRVDSQHKTLLRDVANVFWPAVFRKVYSVVAKKFLDARHIANACDRCGGSDSMHYEGSWRSRCRLTSRMISVVSCVLRLLEMDFVLLPVLDCCPVHRIYSWHSSSVVGGNLYLCFHGFLNYLNPMEVNGGRIDCVVLFNSREARLDRFLDQNGTFWLSFLFARRGDFHCESTIGWRYRRYSPIVGRSRWRVRHGRETLASKPTGGLRRFF